MQIYKTSRITFQRKPDPPSIPSPGKAYGYEEAPDGRLRPQEMPKNDSTMGPAYYNVNHVRLSVVSVRKKLGFQDQMADNLLQTF